MNRLLKLFFFLIACLLLSSRGFAGISVEPNVTEKVMDAGQTEEGKYIVTNTGEKDLAITIEAEDWMQRLFGVPSEIDINEWVTIEPKSIQLKPGEKTEVSYKVSAPVNFLDEKVAQIFFNFQENPDLKSRLGVVLYMSSRSKASLAAEIQDLKAESEPIEGQNEQQLKVTILLKNSSNVHIRPQGVLTITDEKGEKTVKETLLDRIPGIYPGRSFMWVQRPVFKDVIPGKYKIKAQLDYGHTYGKEVLMEKEVLFDWLPQPMASAEIGASAPASPEQIPAAQTETPAPETAAAEEPQKTGSAQ